MIQNIAQNYAYIGGEKGVYDSKIQNPSTRYGRNSVDNYKKYLTSFCISPIELPDVKGLSKMDNDTFNKAMDKLDESVKQMNAQNMPPVNFEHKYMPYNPNFQFIDKDALLGTAYEEMGKRTSMSTAELTQNMQTTANIVIGQNAPRMNAESLDLNNDGLIDLGEYSTSILLEDALSTNDNYFDIRNINGTLTNKGENALFKYGLNSNYPIAKATYHQIYNAYGLNYAQQNFLHNLNNIA